MVAKNNRNNMRIAGATNEVATLKEAVSAAECNAAANEPSERSRRRGWRRYGKSSRLSWKNTRVWSVTQRLESPSLRRLLRVPKPLRPKPTKPSKKSRR